MSGIGATPSSGLGASQGISDERHAAAGGSAVPQREGMAYREEADAVAAQKFAAMGGLQKEGMAYREEEDRRKEAEAATKRGVKSRREGNPVEKLIQNIGDNVGRFWRQISGGGKE